MRGKGKSRMRHGVPFIRALTKETKQRINSVKILSAINAATQCQITAMQIAAIASSYINCTNADGEIVQVLK